MKKLLCFLALCICLTNIKAQYVSIPDANFVTWLQTNVPSAMSGNQMDTTSLAVTTRTNVYVPGLNISSLIGIQYFDSLKVLECSNNQITSLSIIPNMLDSLNVNANPLMSLPILPNNLKSLICSNCNIVYINALPDSLRLFDGAHNPLNSLPTLPLKLTMLNCNGTNISNFPTLPSSLLYFDVGGDTSIITIPNLPNTLELLACEWCQLTTLPILPDSLKYFYCRNNYISTMPSLPSKLMVLAIANNPINCIPTLPESLNYIDLRIMPISCLPNYPSSVTFEGTPSFIIPPLCIYGDSINNPNGCSIGDGIKGYIYLDNNLNCQKDLGDITLNNVKIKLYDSTGNYLNQSSSHSGIYNFVQSLGTYRVVLDTLNVPYKGYCHTSGIDTIVQLTSINQDISDVNFSIKCKPGFDLGVQSVLTNGIVFPGQNHNLKIAAGDMSQWYNLNCASGVSGQLIVNVSGLVTYIAPALGSLTPIVSGTTFTYNIADFGSINFLNDFNIILKTDTTATSGDSICVSVNVISISGDSDINNNSYNLCYGIVNSYDPNMKEVYPINVESGYEDWFTYTIHFQNTGNAPAFNIRLIDTLDANLDLQTFKVINYSHNNTWTINNRTAFFNFQNIQLPDSTSDSEGSKGYVQYRIKPKSNLGAGTKIKNTAYIYFDYNSPIITNTTINEYLQVVSIKENSKDFQSNIYPNPTNGSFTIELNNKEKQFIQLFDITGNTVLSQTIENGQDTIDASNLAAGVYTINIKGNSTVINKKVVIVK